MNSGGDGTAPMPAIGRNICGLFAMFVGRELINVGRREPSSCELYFRLVPAIRDKIDCGSEPENGKDWNDSTISFIFEKSIKNLIFAFFTGICRLFASPSGPPIVNRRSGHCSAQQSGWWRGQTAVICICHRNFHQLASGFGRFRLVLSLLIVVVWVCWVHFWTLWTFFFTNVDWLHLGW